MASERPTGRIIKTPRLILREAQENDLDAFYEMLRDDDVMRYWSGPPHTKISQTRTYLEDMIASPANGITDFVIVLPSPLSSLTGSVIGKVGIWNGESEIGLMLHHSHWGKGYMTEALTALLDYLWIEKRVVEIKADVDPRNQACIGLLNRFGFQEVGREERTFETREGWCDSVYLLLKRAENRE